MAYAFSVDDVDIDNNTANLIDQGTYRAEIIKACIKETKKKNGEFIEITYRIMDNPFKWRYVWGRYNIKNPSVNAVEIGLRNLKALCMAVGIKSFDRPDELEGLELLVGVTIEHSAAYGDSNTVKHTLPLPQEEKEVKNISKTKKKKVHTLLSTSTKPQVVVDRELNDDMPF